MSSPAATSVTEPPTEQPTTVRSILAVASGWLAEQGVEEARLDTELLLAHALGCKRLDLYLDHDKVLTDAERTTFRALMRRRGKREPVAYILGTRGFYGLDLHVAPGALIPRPETELLVEVGLQELDRIARGEPTSASSPPALEASVDEASVDEAPAGEAPDYEESVYEPEPEPTERPIDAAEAAEAPPPSPAQPAKPAKPDGAGQAFADVGTGSGCVALALASERSALRGVATDVSPEALAIARRNLEALDLAERITVREGHLLDGIDEASLDLVVSNPPYVLRSETELLSPEIQAHEPETALFDEPGLPLTRELATQAFRVLRPGGALAIETGFDKAGLVAEHLRAAGFVDVRARPDLAGVERVVVGRRP